jgi:phage shock protein PspC (stress-responsive transcriptional regulator)/tetrahydromethanopterin S-methyltransferase subunit G
MKKVININFQGRILPIEEASYETLKQYIESLRQYFDAEEGRDEIINDIECRIAELCDDRLKKGAVCITEDDMRLIIESIGRPADFEAQDGFEATTNANSSNPKQEQFSDNDENPKRLYRDEQNKVIGGVCAGIANYLKLDPLLVRVLWVLLFGISLFAYVLLWIAVPNTSTTQIGSARKRLFRDIDAKVIGGVCAGLSKYFDIRVRYIRLLFLVPSILLVLNWNHFHLFQFWEFDDFPNFIELTFSPSAVFVYIVLWLVLPEAKTTADKLEMRGEKVDINSIKNTIQTDMEGFGKRAQNWGSSVYNKTKTRETQTASTAANAVSEPAQRGGCLHFAGRTITILFKAFVYFVLGIITISLLAALFGVGIVATGLLPLRRFILEDGAHNWYAYAIIVFFIWVPVIGIVTAIIRKIAGIKKANVWVRGGFWSLWALSWIFIPLFFATLTKSFSKQNDPREQSYKLPNPKVNYLEVSAQPKLKYYNHTWLKIEPFTSYLDQDTAYVRNLRIRIVKAASDSFEIKYVRISNGKTLQEAERLASLINFDLQQKDSSLLLDKGIAINKTDKFRNQHVIMTLAVPVGKRFKITNKGWAQVNVRVNKKGWRSETNSGFIINDGFDGDDWDRNVDTESFDYDYDVEYIMTPTGLEEVGGVKSSDDKDDPEALKNRLEELKRESEQIENDLKKTWEQKQKEADDIKKQLDKKGDNLNRNSTKKESTVSDNVKAIAFGFDAIKLLVSRFQS